MDYPFKEIEQKWQRYWEENKTFQTNKNSSKPKFYCLDMFPYPSGAGLHVGHPEGYTATDIISRYKRMKGFEVLHPMGWDAFGLPAERYAMKTGIHPKETTSVNIQTFKKQIQMIGLSYDWSRELSTTDPDYYKFTQWIFLKIYNSFYCKHQNKARPIQELVKEFEENGSNKYNDSTFKEEFTATEWKAMDSVKKESILSSFRLVYLANVPVNWCEDLGTVLANEEVEEWVSKGHTVVRKPMKQYMMRITAYSERLLNDLSLVSWPESTLEMQKNWIGKSVGVELDFQVQGKKIRVYTTRPDTIFGATYLVLAPEHPLVNQITTEEHKKEVEDYVKITLTRSDIERTGLNKDKTGIFTGAYAENPLIPGSKVPIWISDYVLYGYGTGAIMAVPAHDQRDYEFAKKFNLDIIQVIAGGSMEESAFDSKESTCINSSSSILSIDGHNYQKAFDTIADYAEKNKIGERKTQYKLRDWLFARQRYWGEPIPLVHFPDGLTKALPESILPLELPNVKEFKPSGTGESPLAHADENWLYIYDAEVGQKGRRETNTMPQWAGSCWYYLRYIDPKNPDKFCDPMLEKEWMPVDLYIGGAEHAVLHLLYSRFWHKILYDLGYVSTPEPFKKLVHQGLILGEDKRKMSKSLGNVVNPDDVVTNYGADSLRLFEMFMGPFEMSKPWSTRGVEGIFRFLNRVWRLYHNGKDESFYVDDTEPDVEDLKVLHRTIKKVEDDIQNFSFNTAISQMMILINHFTPKANRPKKILEPFILVLSSFAPHIAEELWNKLGNPNTLAYQPYPSVDPIYLVDDEITIVVQVNGKLRAEFKASKTVSQEEAISKAKSLEKVIPFLEGKTIKKEIYVKEKLVNIVV